VPPRAPTPAYARWVLGLLFVVYVFNFIDRQILAILLQPIKEELGASDTAMGFLTGIAFALFYTFAGIPIARAADRRARRTIIALGVTVWSGMTALSGMVGTFGQLAVARIGVGIGEAALVPPAHSLISDYFPPARRATAIAIFSMGVHVGIACGFLLGGWIAEFFGWRRAFYAVGLPGLGLAVLVRFTVREPIRGRVEGLVLDMSRDSVAEVLRFLWARRSFVHLALAAALHSFGGYAFAVWGPPFFMRVHGMASGPLGTWLGCVLGVGGAIGAVIGGLLGDRFGATDARWKLWVPGIGTLVQIPIVLLVLTTPAPYPAMLFLIPSAVLSAIWFGPVFALTQSLVKVRMRATAAAVLVFVINLIGLGLGPLSIGMLNDVLRPRFGPDAIRYSLVLLAATNVWAAAHFFLAARTIREDLRRVGD
jgi:MFS family permease